MIFTRDSFDESYITKNLSIAGVFESQNLDRTEFQNTVGAVHVSNRRKVADQVTRDGHKFYRYHIITAINHGLARQEKPLPSGVPIHLSFSRASSNKGLVQVKETNKDNKAFTYEHKTIPIIDPVLSCYFVESEKADSLYAKTKMYDVGVNFMDYSMRRELLMNNVQEHNIKIFEGEKVNKRQLTIIRPTSIEYCVWFNVARSF